MTADRAAEPGFALDVSLTRGATSIAARFASPRGITALVGRSGAGKTSLLDMVAGLLTPTQGRIVVDAAVLFDRAAGIDIAPHARGCGYVFQDKRLFAHLSVRDNLLYGWKLAAPERRIMTLDEACGLLGLEGLLHRWPATLSGGEAQRVAIGRALLGAPRFLLMDEPLSALDAPRRIEVMSAIARIDHDLGLPILYVSHQRDEVARLAATVIEID